MSANPSPMLNTLCNDTNWPAVDFCPIMSRCFKIEAMLSTADKNKDNTINYCEFRVRPTFEIAQKMGLMIIDI